MRRYIKPLRIPIFILLVALAIGIVSRHYDISNYLNFEFIQRSQIEVAQWSQQHAVYAYVTYLLCVALLSIPMMMPGVIFIPLVGGFFLEFWPAFLLTVVGVTFSFFVKFVFFHQLAGLNNLRVAGKGEQAPKYSQRVLAKISKNFQQYKLYYFLLLRLLPGFPSWIFAGIAVNAKMKLASFMVWVFFGIMPATALYVYAGGCLVELLHGEYQSWEQTLLAPQIFWPVLAMLLVIFGGFFYCYIKHKRLEKASVKL